MNLKKKIKKVKESEDVQSKINRMDTDFFCQEMQKLAIDIQKKNSTFKYNRIYPYALSYADVYNTIFNELKKREREED